MWVKVFLDHAWWLRTVGNTIGTIGLTKTLPLKDSFWKTFTDISGEKWNDSIVIYGVDHVEISSSAVDYYHCTEKTWNKSGQCNGWFRHASHPHTFFKKDVTSRRELNCASTVPDASTSTSSAFSLQKHSRHVSINIEWEISRGQYHSNRVVLEH